MNIILLGSVFNGVSDKLICQEKSGKCGINLGKVHDLKKLSIVSDVLLKFIEMAQTIIMIRCFDDLFETFYVGWGKRSFIPCFFILYRVCLDIIINIDYMIAFQVPVTIIIVFMKFVRCLLIPVFRWSSFRHKCHTMLYIALWSLFLNKLVSILVCLLKITFMKCLIWNYTESCFLKKGRFK